MRLISVEDPEAIEASAEVLSSGGVVVFPTDTLYGLLAPANEEGVKRVFAVKGRGQDKPSPLFVPDIRSAEKLAHFDERARALWERFMPGPLTLVLRAKIAPVRGIVSDRGTVGLRIPNYPPLMKLLKRLGFPVTGTSANVSGEPPARSFEELSGRILERVDLVVYDPKPLAGLPSTVVDLSEGSIRILREGAISKREIEDALRGLDL